MPPGECFSVRSCGRGWTRNNVARTGGSEPGPGRATLDEILERLEQV